MNTVTAYVWKEWRSQRGLLLAFAALINVTLGLGYLLAPEGYFETDAKRSDLLHVFIACCMGGGLIILAPEAVRSEFHGKSDQFLRRLPGALGPAFAAKLLFLTIAGAALPLAGFVAGEAWMCGRGFGIVPLGDPVRLVMMVTLYAVAMPFVFAVAWCVPGARMAFGAATVVLLAFSFAAGSVLAGFHGLRDVLADKLLEQAPWFALIAVAVGWAAMVLGRRGGGAGRSAAFAATTLAIALIPHGLWFASWVRVCRHPEVGELRHFEAIGISPDGAFALVRGKPHPLFDPATIRVDLARGSAEVIADPCSTVDAWLGDVRRRCWRIWHGDRSSGVTTSIDAFDLLTGERRLCGVAGDHFTAPGLEAQLRSDRRLATTTVLPGNVTAWLGENEVRFAAADGSESSFALPGALAALPAGHGLLVATAQPIGHVCCDLLYRRLVAVPRLAVAIALGGRWLYRATESTWQLLDGRDDAQTQAAGLQPVDQLLGKLDDESALMLRHGDHVELFAYRLADGAVLPIESPAELAKAPFWSRCGGAHAGLADPRGRPWVFARQSQQGKTVALVTVDPVTRRATVVLRVAADARLLAFDSDHTVVIGEDDGIHRFDFDTGARTRLFPR